MASLHFLPVVDPNELGSKENSQCTSIYAGKTSVVTN